MYFVELIEHAKSHRGRIVPIREIQAKVERPFEAFSSMFYYDEGILTHVSTQAKATVAGYEGAYYCRLVWFDIDHEDLNLSLTDARNLVNRLVNKYKVSRWDLVVYFSGGKGFHIGVYCEHFGGFSPTNDLPYKIGKLVTAIAGDIEGVDTSIYNPNRFWRLPNSKHEKTGLYKIPLAIHELQFTIDHIKELAQKPRLDFRFQPSNIIPLNAALQREWQLVDIAPKGHTEAEKKVLNEVPENAFDAFKLAVKMTQRKFSAEQYHRGNRNNYMHLLTEWCNDFGIGEPGVADEALELITTHAVDDLKDDPATWDMSNVENTIKGVYRRHLQRHGQKGMWLKENAPEAVNTQKTKLKMLDEAVRLNKWTRLSQKEILRLLMALNRGEEAPLTDGELYDIAVFASNGKHAERAEDDHGKTIAELVPAFITHATRASRFGLGIAEIDKLERYDYTGRLVGIVGKAGMKKSMLLKDILCCNAIQQRRGVYSSMEDAALGQFRRILNRSFSPPSQKAEDAIGSPEEWLTEYLRNGNGSDALTERIMAAMDEMYGSNLIIDEKVAMQKENFEWLLNKVIQKRGPVDLLGVDGLSMMGGNGSELETAVKNSRELKELAKIYNICVAALIHVPKEVSREVRNLADHTRMGAKVLDNLDIVISLSACRNDEKSTPGNPAYYEDLIYLHYWGKRTTGKTVEMIMRLDPVTLLLNPTDISPGEFNME